MFGSPAAMQMWDRYYDFLVKEKGFAAKVVPEGAGPRGFCLWMGRKKSSCSIELLVTESFLRISLKSCGDLKSSINFSESEKEECSVSYAS